MLKEKEKDFLISLIIGDGSLYEKDTACTIEVGHGKSQKDYCQWKLNLLNKSNMFANEIKMETRLCGKEKQWIQYRFRKTDKKLNDIFNLININGRKNVSNCLEHLRSDRGVAIWFMDDGGVEPSRRKQNDGTVKYYRPNIKLCTHCFSYEEQILIKNWFYKKYQIHCNIKKEIKKNRVGQPEYYFLRFGADSTELLYKKILKDYIHCCQSMEIKFKHIINFYENNIL